jgi:hypothetical protein
VSSAELSREISRLVVRIVGGEAIDVSAQGAALAARFPELGMSAELIGKAISRAASMVGHPLEPHRELQASGEACASTGSSRLRFAPPEG